ncbi:MAG: hypothetical protein ACLPKT_08125 [Methylocella sp.]
MKQQGEAMTHSSRRNPKVKAIAEVLAMIADADPKLAAHHPSPALETDEWLWESAAEFCAVLDRYAGRTVPRKSHGPRQQELLGCRLNDALKCDRVERLEICCCLCRPANGARYSNHNGQLSRCHESLLGKTRTWLLMERPRPDREHKGIPVIEAMQTGYARREFF